MTKQTATAAKPQIPQTRHAFKRESLATHVGIMTCEQCPDLEDAPQHFNDKGQPLISVSQWLSERDGHSIYDSEGLKGDFTEATGLSAPDWPEHTRAQTVRAMNARGLGGTLGPEDVMLAYGWQIAETLAAIYAPDQELRPQFGRGSRFRVALDALRKAGA